MSDRPKSATKPVLAIEFLLGQAMREPLITAVVSIPGRDGTFTRSWGEVGRGLSEPEHKDLATWVLVTIRHTYLARFGIQSVLPIDQ